MGLCELVRANPLGIGTYRVEKIVGYTEPDDEGVAMGVTYVSMMQTASWIDGSTAAITSSTTARTDGGPVGPKCTKSWGLSLNEGEEVLMLFNTPQAWNKGYNSLDSLQIFHRRQDGTFSNGQLFSNTRISDQALRKKIKRSLEI